MLPLIFKTRAAVGLSGILCLAVFSNCASAGQAPTWQDVKQEVGPSVAKPATVGYLRVYTKDETVNDGGYLWQRGPRYTVFKADGKRIGYFQNEFGAFNTLALPPGKYVIVPADREYRNEVIGAILEQGKVTQVHMMGG